MHVTDLVGTRVIPLFTHTPILLPASNISRNCFWPVKAKSPYPKPNLHVCSYSLKSSRISSSALLHTCSITADARLSVNMASAIPLICIFLISPSTPAERVAHINITFSQFFKWLAIDFPSNVKLIPGTCPSTKSKTLYVYLPSITDLSWSAQLYKISFVFSSGVLFP